MLPVYVCLVFLLLLIFIYYWTQRRIKRQEKMMDIEALAEYLKITNQDEDVWNISSRVNQQNQSSVTNQPNNWPTHDTHIPVDSFVLPPDYRFKDTRPPPPPYSEVGLPSYEQAVGTGTNAEPAPVHASSSERRNNPGPSS